MTNRSIFITVKWHQVETDQLQDLKDAVAALDTSSILNTPIEKLLEEFEKFKIDIPNLLADQVVMSPPIDAQIDISQDLSRHVLDRTRPHYIVGTKIEFEIPFNGDANAFNIQPTRYSTSPPEAQVRGNALVINEVGINPDSDRIRANFGNTVREIETYLEWLRSDASGFNAKLLDQARSVIEARRKKLLADRKLAGSLGRKMKT